MLVLSRQTGWRSQRVDAPQCAHFATDICCVNQEGVITRKVCAPRCVSAPGAPHILSDKTNLEQTLMHHFNQIWLRICSMFSSPTSCNNYVNIFNLMERQYINIFNYLFIITRVSEFRRSQHSIYGILPNTWSSMDQGREGWGAVWSYGPYNSRRVGQNCLINSNSEKIIQATAL